MRCRQEALISVGSLRQPNACGGLAGEMALPPEEVDEVEEGEAPAPTKAPEARAPKKVTTAPAPAPGPLEIVETDMAYIDRPSPFFTRAPDSES